MGICISYIHASIISLTLMPCNEHIVEGMQSLKPIILHDGAGKIFKK